MNYEKAAMIAYHRFQDDLTRYAADLDNTPWHYFVARQPAFAARLLRHYATYCARVRKLRERYLREQRRKVRH